MSKIFDESTGPLKGSYAVYFSGVHVPALRVTVNNTVWEMPQASIELPSSYLMHRFGHDDRVQVAVFYKDLFYSDTDSTEGAYRLLFDGEITSYSRTQSAGSAAVQFSAVSHLQVFAELFVTFITNVADLAGSYVGTGSELGILQDRATFPTLFFSKGLDAQTEVINRPYDFIRNMLSSLVNNGSVQTDGNPLFVRSIPVQKFFNRHRKLVKLAKRFASCPIVETRLQESGNAQMFPVVHAVGDASVIKALQNRAQGFSNKSSLWQLLYTTFQIMFYDILFLNAAPYILSDHAGNILGKVSHETPRVTDDHLLREVTDSEPGKVFQLSGKSVKLHMDAAYRSASTTDASVMSGSSSGSANPIWDGLEYSLAYPQLGQYITKPQMLFAIPPRCNIFFPSMVKAMSYNENYATQPTRLYIGDIEWLLTGGPSSSAQLDVADNAMRTAYPEEVNLRLKALMAGQAKGSVYDQLVWPHEYFHGVIMSREDGPMWLRFMANDPAIIKAYSESADEEERSDEPSAADQPDDGKFTAGTYNDRVTRLYSAYAKYRFYQEKYSRRRGSISLAFNPYVVAGLPCMYIDKANQNEHMLAYVTSVSWNLSVGNMSTEVSYTYGRSVYENEELLRKKFLSIDPDLKTGYASLVQPDDPVYTLVAPTQQYAGANELYRKLLYQNGLGDTDTDNYTGAYQALLEREVFGADNIELATDGSSVPTGKYQLVLRPELTELNDNFVSAMRFVSRPVCTIDEYIHFINGVEEDEKVSFDPDEPGKYMYLRHYTYFDPTTLLELAEVAEDTEGKMTFDLCTQLADSVDTRAPYEEVLDALHRQVYEQQAPNA